MRAHGALLLQVSGATIQEFMETFPDAKSWLTMFKPADPVASAMAEIGYSGPPELLTTYLCMLGTKQMDYSNASAIEQCQVSNEAALGFGPLLVWCLQIVEQQGSPCVSVHMCVHV